MFHILSRIRRVQQRFSTRGPFSTCNVSDLIINAAWGFKFIPWSYGSFWALSTLETSQQCVQEVLNEHLWADQPLGLWVKCFSPGSAWIDDPPREQKACPEDSSSSNPASIHHWTLSCHACSGACCHCLLPTASPSQFSWAVTKPGVNPFSRSPHPLHTLQHWLPKKDVTYFLFCCPLLRLCVKVLGNIVCLHSRRRGEGSLTLMQRSQRNPWEFLVTFSQVSRQEQKKC